MSDKLIVAGLSSGNFQDTLKVLCLGAHSDDIEIGCGGTLLRLLGSYKQVEVTWMVFSGSKNRREEARKSAALYLRSAHKKHVSIRTFRESYFPYEGEVIKDEFERLKRRCDPDIIFTHFRHDLHQDHQVINSLTWNTWRNHLILEYEVPKYDGDLGAPNTFIQLEGRYCEMKVRNLMTCFGSQRPRQWFSEDTFWALLRLRGIESGTGAKYAEAFYCRKMVWRTAG